MKLTSLGVTHFRAHKDFRVHIHPTVTLITGANGSGKTSLLEAVYIALQGSSFKGSDTEAIQHNTPWYRIDVVFDDGSARTVKFDPNRPSGKKQFIINNQTHYRLSFDNKYPVVLFEPDELRLLGGSPVRRRQFIDRFISQFDPEYALSLRRYERSLKQRNNLLRHHQSAQSDVFAWDVSLSKYGAYIIGRRLEVIERLQPNLKKIYKDIARSKDAVVIRYSENYNDSIEQRLLGELHRSIERDRHLGYTSVGPHRHDVLFDLNNSPAAGSASRGEVRTIVLALKFLEVDIIKERTGRIPTILLDDVFSELDKTRQEALMDRFSDYQTIITSVEADTTEYPVHRLI